MQSFLEVNGAFHFPLTADVPCLRTHHGKSLAFACNPMHPIHPYTSAYTRICAPSRALTTIRLLHLHSPNTPLHQRVYMHQFTHRTHHESTVAFSCTLSPSAQDIHSPSACICTLHISQSYTQHNNFFGFSFKWFSFFSYSHRAVHVSARREHLLRHRFPIVCAFSVNYYNIITIIVNCYFVFYCYRPNHLFCF